MRLDLPDGQWAELRERINHKTDRELRKAWREHRDGDADIDAELARAFVRDWSVRDPDGNSVPFADPDATDRVESSVFDLIVTQAIEQWTGATVPNSPTPD